MSEQQGQTELGLSGKDVAACDALIEAGMDASKAPPSVERRRVSRLVSLLGLLRAGPRPDSALVDVTFARINRAADNASVGYLCG